MSERIRLFELEIDSSKLLRELADTSKAIADLTRAQRENKRNTDEERRSYEANAIILRNLRGEYSNNQRVLQALTRTTTQNITTVADARRALSNVSVLWAELTNVYGENSEEAKALAEEKLRLTERLKQLEGATGDTRRNVGNYTNSLKEALQQTGGLAGGALKLFDTLKANPFILILDLVVKLGREIGKAQGIVDAFNQVWQPLFAIFQRFVGIAQDAVLPIFEGLSDGTKSFGDVLKDLGKAIIDNIINRFTAFKVLGEGVALLFQGKLTEAVKKFGDGVIQFTSGVEDGTDKFGKLIDEGSKAAKVGTEIAKVGKEIAILNVQIQTSEAKTRTQIETLRNFARQQGVSAAEGKKALQEASKLEEKIEKDRNKIVQLRIKEAKLKASLNDTDLQAQLEIAKIEGERDTNEAARLTRQRELIEGIKTLTAAEAAQAKAAAAAETAATKAQQQATAKAAEEQVKLFELTNKTRIDDETELTAELVAAETERFGKLIALKEDFIKKSAIASGQSEVETKVLLDGLAQQFQDYVAGLTEKSAQQGVDKLVDTIKQARLALDKSRANAPVLITPEQVDEEKELLRGIAQAEKEALDAKLKNKLISEVDYQRDLFDLNKRFADQTAALDTRALTEEQKREAFEFQSRLQAAQAQGQLSLELRQEQLERQKQIELAAAEAVGADITDVNEKYRVLNEQLDKQAVQARLQTAANYLNTFAQIVGDQTLFGKLAASVAAGVNTALAITEALKAPTLAQRIAGVAFASATGLKSIIEINKAKPPKAPAPRPIPKFGQGGAFEIGGNYHSSGGTDFIGSDGSRFNAERNEMLFILNRNASSQLKSLSSFNKLFPMASRIGGFQAGGIPPLNGGNAELVSAFREQPIVVDVKDIISETSRRVELVDSATL
jgi:hypothetical protein